MEGFFTVVSLLLCQMFSDPVRGAEMAQNALRQQTAIQDRAVKEREGQARRQFEQQFNKLVTALGEFSAAYNHARGDVWPAKQAAALKKAMRDLQLSRLDSNDESPRLLSRR